MKPFGLILAGGESRRMGTNKAEMRFADGRTWSEHAVAIVTPFVQEIFVSVRAGDQHPLALYDDAQNIGPAAGLLAAYRKNTDRAWLILAVDFPFATPESIRLLIEHAMAHKTSIVCYETGGRPEPLFAVWPALALQLLETNVARGLTGPIATLKEFGASAIKPLESNWVRNINSPDQLAQD